MHCRNCNYPLWNLKSRSCPECGSTFRPSDHEFVPQSVRFCCPHCDHPYYGTDEKKGHIEPRAFQCVRCGRPVTMDQMVLRPGLGVEEQLTRPDTMPWLDRRQRGRVRAWFQMIGKGLTAPAQLIVATPPDSTMRQAWLFGLVSCSIFFATGTGIQVWFTAMWIGMANAWMVGFTGFGRATIPIFFAALLLASAALTILLVWLWTLSAHGILLVTGPVAHSYRRTCQALLYSAGANVFSVVPCFGMYVGTAWWIVSGTLMVRRAQGVGGARAAFAVATLPGLLLVGFVGLFAAAIVMPRLMGGGAVGPWSLSAGDVKYQTSIVNYGLMSYGFRATGAVPEHAIELALSDSVLMFGGTASSPLFCDPSTRTTAEDVPIGDGTLADFDKASRGKQLAIAAELIASMPGNVVAHRLGDYVFTYHGAAAHTFDANLWTVVMLADPDVNGPPAGGDLVIIGTANYDVTETTAGELPALLKAQNRHRATLGLPALPDLATVMHGRPALAPAESGSGESGEDP